MREISAQAKRVFENRQERREVREARPILESIASAIQQENVNSPEQYIAQIENACRQASASPEVRTYVYDMCTRAVQDLMADMNRQRPASRLVPEYVKDSRKVDDLRDLVQSLLTSNGGDTGETAVSDEDHRPPQAETPAMAA